LLRVNFDVGLSMGRPYARSANDGTDDAAFSLLAPAVNYFASTFLSPPLPLFLGFPTRIQVGFGRRVAFDSRASAFVLR
jgi:hypothetical protein